MTSVVGILSKRGAAIAADSAVTRSRNKENGFREYEVEKVTKNGNKMVRLSDVDPISVMFTGNADFLCVPWDVIARRYRQQKGREHHPTVEAAARDFFDYIASSEVFWDNSICNGFLKYIASRVFNEAMSGLFEENERKDDGTMKRPGAFRKVFIRHLASVAKQHVKGGSCPQFEGYSIEEFRKYASTALDEFFEEKYIEKANGFAMYCYPKEVIDAVRPNFEEALLKVLSSRMYISHSATLVFVGYGEEQEYPSLLPAVVCDGYANRVNYSIRTEDIICISDERPVAICPFAQKDVIKSIIRGIHEGWSDKVIDNLRDMTRVWNSDIFDPFPDEDEPDVEFTSMLFDIDSEDLNDKFVKEGLRMLDANQREWEKALEKYDLEEMAALADSLINLTSFHRILTFSQEGVGGLVDLGVLSRNEGFTWLRRKSWYHKDNGGSEGQFGV